MAHPKETKRIGGKLYHLEDERLKKSEANAIKKHLRFTEDKRVRTNKNCEGYQVWWSK